MSARHRPAGPPNWRRSTMPSTRVATTPVSGRRWLRRRTVVPSSSSAAAPAACSFRWRGPAPRSPGSTSPRRCSNAVAPRSMPSSPRCAIACGCIEADMTTFDLGRRFASIICPFAGFQQLLTVDQQLACLGRCRAHLLPRGRLVLDLPNPDPAPAEYARDGLANGEATVQLVDWTDGRRIRWWMTVVGYDRLLQCNECEVTYEIIEHDGATRRIDRDDLPALHVPLRTRAPALPRRLPTRRPLRRLRLLAARGRFARDDRRGAVRRRVSARRC